uniref:Farnesoic acid O-methyl transferase domain-containing protein n=1 Tax=Magallana gigas TaxID=29159 RepID=A0A8W8LKQ9_MAGGI|nr:uncharacterized protein LOC117682290 [Crassostrea gigas]
MVLKFHLLLLCIVCSGAVEQILWTMVKEMNDINSNLHVVHQRENTRCLECGTRAKMMNGQAFSCHNGDQLCSVHYKCLLKFNLLTGTWITEVGWKHFCNNIHVTAPTTWIDIGPLLLGRLSLQFSVKASNDAYFGLSSGNTTAFPGYWIILEGFSMDLNCIRDGFVSGTCYSQHIGSYLSPREFVRYWVQWDHGNVRVGIGEAVGSSKIMEHQFPTAYPISNVLLRNGQWIIYL